MTQIPMSYGHIDLETFVEHTKEMAREIYAGHPWEKDAIEWTDINEKSVVVEVGAYHGLWAFRMAERYNPKLYLFEPQPWCESIIRGVMKGYKYHLYPYALGVMKGDFPVFEYETDGCTFDTTEDRGWGLATLHMEKVDEVFELEKIKHIDLMNVNAEGAEFYLFPYMFEKGIFPEVLMFQGHNQGREPAVRELVGKYYTLIWDYGTPLSAWRKIGPVPSTAVGKPKTVRRVRSKKSK